MRNIIFLILISFILTGCSGTKSFVDKDFYLDYSVTNLVTNFEIKIVLKEKVLNVMYTDILSKNRNSKQFTGQDSLSLAAYNYVRKNKFETIVQPEQSNALDASTETLKIKYDSNNFSIDLSRVSNKPETVTALLESIFDYIEKHIPGWQKEAGLK